MDIKKGIILAAGVGSRLMPMTKSIPKPMIPVAGKPTIDYIIEEALQSGIEEIAIVCNHKKEVLMDYFTDEKFITFIEQPNTFGTAHALKSALDFIGTDDFALFFGDEIVLGETPCTKQLIDIYKSLPGKTVTGIESASKECLYDYNVLSIERTEIPKLAFIKDIIEKPRRGTILPSTYTAVGRYIITNEITSYLKKLNDNPPNEIPLTEYFDLLSKKNNFVGYYFEGKRYDMGTKEKWIKTNVEINAIEFNTKN